MRFSHRIHIFPHDARSTRAQRGSGYSECINTKCPHTGTPMTVPINFRLMRSSVDTDTSIRIPMRRAAHRSGKKGSPMDGHKVPSWHEGCKHVCGVHSCPHPGAAPSFIFNPAHTHYVAFGEVASMVVSCLRAPHHTCCNFIYKLMHIKVDATMLCAIAARIMRGSVDIEQHRLFAPHV